VINVFITREIQKSAMDKKAYQELE